jgi:ATP-dependent helicase/nuclease subunit B
MWSFHMLHLLYGRAGSGKTTLLFEKLKDCTIQGKKVLLLVPEQQVFETEKRVCDEKIFSLNLEVVGFRRLCNLLFRKWGGLSYHYIGYGAKRIIMWRVLQDLSPTLSKFTNISLENLSVLDLMVRTIEEMERYNITPTALEQLTNLPALSKDHRLIEKCKDISGIYELYLQYLRKDYDNPEEDLTRAADLLNQHPAFSDMEIFVDGFFRFSPQETEILKKMMEQADEITITIPCLPHDRVDMYRPALDSERKIRKLASDTGCKVDEPKILNGRFGCEKEDLNFLIDHLWNFDKEEYEHMPPSISLTVSEDMYREAETVACKIAELVQNKGLRYREIAVIMRDPASYEGILDAAFEKQGIPCFSSTRTRLCTKPQIRLIRSALEIGASDWQYESVISYIRCGLSGLSQEESDLLEEYATTWNISGSMWYDPLPWTMNPHGFVLDDQKEDLEKCQKIQAIRLRLIDPLVHFLEQFSTGSCTVRSLSEALYQFLIQMQVPEGLKTEEKELRENGQHSLAQECAQVWKVILNALDDLVVAAGDRKTTLTEFSRLLFAIFDTVDIGKIPARLDEVIIGEPKILRKSGIRYAFLLGLNEGIFPSAGKGDALFSDEDKIKMSQLGVTFSDTRESAADSELYGVYRACTLPSEGLYLSYHSDLNPSVAVFAICALFPQLEKKNSSQLSAMDKIWSYESAFEFAVEKREKDLLDFLAQNAVYKKQIQSLQIPIDESKGKIQKETADLLMGQGVNLTQARIENFVKCPFSYYGKNILGLKEESTDEFGAADVGNFMHVVFEYFFKKLSGKSVKNVTDVEIDTISKEAITAYRLKITGGRMTHRLEHLFSRLESLCQLLIQNLTAEFRQSLFEPTFLELPIDQRDANVSPLQIPLSNGKTISLYGRVDRVDTYRCGKDVYVRVVDYKTGSKKFALSDLDDGLNLQMPIYLFSICSSRHADFLKSVGCSPEGKLIPAGFLYYSAKVLSVDISSPNLSADQVKKIASDEIDRSGLLLSDFSVLKAMEDPFLQRYIPVKLKKDGTPTGSIASAEKLEEIREKTVCKIGEIGEKMASGDSSATPMKNNGQDVCQCCPLHPVCRISFSEIGSEDSISENG